MKFSTTIKYAVTATIGTAIAVLIASQRGGLSPESTSEALMAWCDGCFASAVLIGSVGLLAYVSSGGFFDIFSFGIRKLILMFQRDDDKLKGSYLDYKTEKAAKGRGGFGFLLVTAIVFLAAAFALLALYSQY